MVYEDYLKVALKHLRTCEYLKDNLSKVHQVEKKDAILRNLYYLCGYVLEGVINYGIYKTYYHNRPNQLVQPLFWQVPSTSDWVCYNYPSNSEKSANPTLNRYWKYRLTNHEYMRNKEIIISKLNIINRTQFSHINIFLSPAHSSSTIARLFHQWNVNTIRYESSTTSTRSPINYNETDIIAFFEFVKETYRVLPNLL